MNAAPSIVTLGAHVLDTIVQPVDEIPEGQGSLLVDEIVMSAAGPAGGTALVLNKLGARVVTSGAVGDDVAGRVLVGLLGDAGIDVSNLRTDELPTSASVLPIRSDGSRPALHVVGANALAADVVPWDALAAADHVHVGAPELLGPENVIEILEYARRHGATTSLDFLIGGDPAFYALIKPLLAHTDYVLPNAEQAIGWTGADDLPAAARALHAAGAAVVACTNGGDDIVVVDGGDLEFVPIVPAEPVDTSGGGDAFSAGFVFAKLRGWSSRDAARLVKGTAGNVSVRVDGGIAITATGVVFAEAVADDVVIVDGEKRVVEGALAPSSELDLHRAAYADEAVGAVVHTHAPAAIALSLVSDRLPCVHYQQLALGGEIDVVPFSVFGSAQLAADTGDALAAANAAILAHHGAVTTGRDLADAVTNTALLEWACDIYLRARAVAVPAELSPEQQAAVLTAAVSTGYGHKHGA